MNNWWSVVLLFIPWTLVLLGGAWIGWFWLGVVWAWWR